MGQTQAQSSCKGYCRIGSINRRFLRLLYCSNTATFSAKQAAMHNQILVDCVFYVITSEAMVSQTAQQWEINMKCWVYRDFFYLLKIWLNLHWLPVSKCFLKLLFALMILHHFSWNGPSLWRLAVINRFARGLASTSTCLSAVMDIFCKSPLRLMRDGLVL